MFGILRSSGIDVKIKVTIRFHYGLLPKVDSMVSTPHLWHDPESLRHGVYLIPKHWSSGKERVRTLRIQVQVCAICARKTEMILFR